MFDRGERQPARDMKRYRGAFALRGNPNVPGQATWRRYDTRRVVLSLRPGGRSTAISDATLRAEHQCAFWDSLPAPASAAGQPD
jgi:hypothetical protein